MKNDVPFAHYVFPSGPHGIGLAATGEDIDGSYVMEQVRRAVSAVRDGNGVNVSDDRRRELDEQFPDGRVDWGTENPHDLSDVGKDAGMWAELAYIWLSRL